MQTQRKPDRPQAEFEDYHVVQTGLEWPGLPAGSVLFLGTRGVQRGDGLYLLEMDGCRWLRRVNFRVGEVWLWHDIAPVGTREAYSTAEFEAQIRNVMRPVVGRFSPCCSDLAADLVEMGEIRSRTLPMIARRAFADG